MPVYVTSQTPEGQLASSSWVTDTPEVQIAAVDATGRFRFDDVQPGSYTAAYRFNERPQRRYPSRFRSRNVTTSRSTCPSARFVAT